MSGITVELTPSYIVITFPHVKKLHALTAIYQQEDRYLIQVTPTFIIYLDKDKLKFFKGLDIEEFKVESLQVADNLVTLPSRVELNDLYVPYLMQCKCFVIPEHMLRYAEQKNIYVEEFSKNSIAKPYVDEIHRAQEEVTRRFWQEVSKNPSGARSLIPTIGDWYSDECK